MLPKREEPEVAPPEEKLTSCLMDAVLPIAISPKWVAYGCRMAGLAKPRWSRESAVWTSSVLKDNGITETITISKSGSGKSDRTIQVKVEWLAWNGEPSETATARRFVTTLITGMQWSLRQRSQTMMSIAANAHSSRW